MTYELKESEKKAFLKAIQNIPEDYEYTVLRNYESIPDKVPGVDIDILTHQNKHKEIQEIFFDVGFERFNKESDIKKKQAELIIRGVNNPLETIKRISDSPRKVYDVLFEFKQHKYHTGSEGFVMTKTTYESLEVDFYNHLAYRSPLNDHFYRVDPVIERHMLSNRQKYGEFYVPSAVDELTHLVCRGVFDHQGDFRNYYVNRCEELYPEVDRNDLRNLLEKIFFDAHELVLSLIEDRKYDEIKPQLISYSDY